MENLSSIKNRVLTIESIVKATNAMKMVSTIKLAKIGALKCAKECSDILFDMLSKALGNMIFNQSLEKDHWIIPKENGRTLIMIFSADQGFCAGFNQNITEVAKKTVSEYTEPIVKIFGKKAASICSTGLVPIKNRVNFENFAKIAKEIVMDHLINHDVSRIITISSTFRNLLSQKARVEQIFPFKTEATPEYVKLENMPNIDSLFSMYIDKLFQAIITEHVTAELSARVIAMDNSVKNARDMVKSLNSLYNSVRQAKITKELIEIIASMESVR